MAPSTAPALYGTLNPLSARSPRFVARREKGARVTPTLETKSGRVRGVALAGCRAFLGVPYAEAPTGKARFRAPSAPTPWTGERDGRERGADMIQFGDGRHFFDYEDRPQSEDALTVNVWTPELAPARRPIMVFVHGGGFALGGGSRLLYDGQALTRDGDVVVVTINYRLGPLGLLAHPSLAVGDGDACGNWAILDQIAALRWVQEHAAAIGGDPDRVTLFGESAGSVSVGILCAIPQARGLFQSAIMQSGAPRTIPFEQALRATRALCDAAGVASDDPSALRTRDVDALVEASPAWLALATRNGYALRPTVDGVVLPEQPLELAAKGNTREIELVVGTNRDELNMYAGDPGFRTIDASTLRERVGAIAGDDHDPAKLVDVYREARAERGEGTEPWQIMAAILTDAFVRRDSLRFLERHVENGGAGHAYLVDWASPTPDLGSCHGIELPFCFGTLETAPGMPKFAGEGETARALASRMVGAWSAFAHGEGRPFGARYDLRDRSTMRFGAACGETHAPREAERRAWEA